jgi:hypothetical protein
VRLRTPYTPQNDGGDGDISSRLRMRSSHLPITLTSQLAAQLQYLQNNFPSILWSMPDPHELLEEQDLIDALRESAQMDQSSPRLELQDLKLPQIPSTTRPGYTRGINKNKDLMCARCDVELGIGIPDSEKDSSITDGDRLLSKRVFFARCGHTYCGRCVNDFLNRDHKKRGLSKACVVPDCKQSFKRQRVPFREIYY